MGLEVGASGQTGRSAHRNATKTEEELAQIPNHGTAENIARVWISKDEIAQEDSAKVRKGNEKVNIRSLGIMDTAKLMDYRFSGIYDTILRIFGHKVVIFSTLCLRITMHD